MEALRITVPSPAHSNTGFKGVAREESKHGPLYRARIYSDKRLVFLGKFKTPEEAHQAYCEAESKLSTGARQRRLMQFHGMEITPKERLRWLNVKGKYKLTMQQCADLFNLQEGACGICKKALDFSNGRSWHIDHDHTSGVVRGFLCQKCNMALGRFKDSVEMLERAINYLKSPPWKL